MFAKFAIAIATAALLAIAVGQSANAQVPSKQTSTNAKVPSVPTSSTPVAQPPRPTGGTVQAPAPRPAPPAPAPKPPRTQMQSPR